MAPWRPCSNLSTNRIKLVVSYDGTDFCGWAPQAGQRAVQSTLKEAVRRISGEEGEIARLDHRVLQMGGDNGEIVGVEHEELEG